jgi:hypothetical protein
MVTATYGTAIFQGIASKKIYAVDLYISDVIGDVVNFDSGNGAGATTLGFWKAPEALVLTDLSIVAGNTVTTQLVPTADGGLIPGVRLREANFLNTLPTRSQLSLGFKQGTNISFTQA